MLAVLGGIGSFINTKVFMAKLMREFQYVKMTNADQDDKELMKRSMKLQDDCYCVTYTTRDIFSEFKNVCCRIYWCSLKKKKKHFLSRSEYLFQRGYDQLETELTDHHLINADKKFKAALSQAYHCQDDRLKQVKKLFQT